MAVASHGSFQPKKRKSFNSTKPDALHPWDMNCSYKTHIRDEPEFATKDRIELKDIFCVLCALSWLNHSRPFAFIAAHLSRRAARTFPTLNSICPRNTRKRQWRTRKRCSESVSRTFRVFSGPIKTDGKIIKGQHH